MLDSVYGTIRTGLEFAYLMSRYVRLYAAGFLLVAFSAGAQPPTVARIQDGSADVCWSPDIEWPVPCDDED